MRIVGNIVEVTRVVVVQSFAVSLVLLLLLICSTTISNTTTIAALPLSHPYIAYRTDAYNHTTGSSGSSSTSNITGTSIGFVIHNKYHWDEAYHEEMKQQQQQQQKQQHAYMYHQDIVSHESQCPFQFTIGTSKRIHSAVSMIPQQASSLSLSTVSSQPPLILPIPPAAQSTTTAQRHNLNRKQILFNTNYEHLDLYYSTSILPSSSSSTTDSTTSSSSSSSSNSGNTPTKPSTTQFQSSRNRRSSKNRLQQDMYYPLLFESSIMTNLHPILYDVNYDGLYDIIVTDYDGGITVISSSSANGGGHEHNKNHKAYHHTQVPRLFIRREWMEHFYMKNDTTTTTNETQSPDNTKRKGRRVPHDPFHSYFEFYYATSNNPPKMDLIRGHSANVLHQDKTTHETLQGHRRQVQNENQMKRRLLLQQPSPLEDITPMIPSPLEETILSQEGGQQQQHQHHSHRRLQEVVDVGMDQNNNQMDVDDVGIPELVDNNNKDGNEGMEGDDDAAILRDIDDEQHQFDRNPNHREQGIDHEEEEEQEEEEPQQQGEPQHDDPILADIRHKQNDIMKQELSSDGVDGEVKTDPLTIEDVDQMPRGVGDDMAYDEPMMDDHAMYARHGDDMYPGGGADYAYNDYYDSKHYIRLPPHILTTPTLMEIPKLYSSDKYEKEDMLFVAISYYFDEDEYDGLLSSYQRFQNTDLGDETEARRGSYIASAIMVYVIGSDGSTSQRWIGQTHLDLSSDYTAPENITVVGQIPIHTDVTQMSALALASPTIVDLDGDGKYEVIIGTNMGILYVFNAQQMLLQREHWPIQLVHPIEHPILVEDVIGTTSLEMFVTDVGGTLACLNHHAEVLWQHNLVLYLPLNTEHNIDPTATSPMTLGDVDGDGFLDIVQIIRTQSRSFIFAVTASTGNMLLNYPIELDGKISLDDEAEEVHYKSTQPLLVDLHTDQSFLHEYLHRNGGTAFNRPVKASTSKTTKDAIPNGGTGSGLHIVVPHGDAIFIVEGSTGCTHKIEMGTEVSAMVQVDDVHGTDQLDLVIVTGDGNVVTLETSTPYHPLNTWTGGSVRNHRSTSHVHGYSASQGIFVHDITRQYTDIFGVYVPITFEIFDNRPNISNEPDQRKYLVEVRDGPSWKRALWRNTYNATGVYTERVYIRYGPGFYTLYVVMQTSHGIIYEDTFSIGYNIHFLDGLDVYLWLPLLIAAIIIFLFGASKQPNWNSIHEIDNYNDDDNNSSSTAEYYDNGREGHSLGILGRAQLPT